MSDESGDTFANWAEWTKYAPKRYLELPAEPGPSEEPARKRLRSGTSEQAMMALQNQNAEQEFCPEYVAALKKGKENWNVVFADHVEQAKGVIALLKDALPTEDSEAKQIFLSECSGTLAWLNSIDESCSLKEIAGSINMIFKATQHILSQEMLDKVLQALHSD